MHCKHELFHAVWKIILDNEFVEAYKNGIVIKCHNGVLHRDFPRIFTYSADYPKKCVKHSLCTMIFTSFDRVLIATIHDKGLYPCPRCLIPKSSFHRLGFLSDLKWWLSCARTYLWEMICAARHKIYELGNPIKGMAVERILKDKSLVPTLVRQHLLFCVCSLNCCIRIPLLSALHHLALTYSLSSLWISCMSLNLECWSLFSDTWSEYSMLLTQA